jgi:hypothetical protein
MASFEPLSPIEHPRCSRCRTHMTLVWRIARNGIASSDHQESRIFGCAKCHFVETVKVPDPLTVDWLKSLLQQAE